MLLAPISYISMMAITLAVFFLAVPTFANDQKNLSQIDCTTGDSCVKNVIAH